MTSDNVNVLAPIVWVAGGFFIGVFLLAGITGGLILGLVAGAVVLLGMPFIVTISAVDKLRERRGTPAKKVQTVTVAKVEEAPATVQICPEPARRSGEAAAVSMRVVEARGTCPLGYTFHVGEEFTFTNGTVTPSLCSRAHKALLPLTKQLRAGQYPTITRPYCQTGQHLVVFEFQKKRVTELVS
ncbi:MAG: hypothetical protein ACE5JL_11760 [Dehalococcoidia bacterium]